MIAPAWPIRRPGGAVTPAMNDTTGFAFAPEFFSWNTGERIPMNVFNSKYIF